MGRDKATLELDGAPLWARQRDVLARAGAAEIFLSARPDQGWVAAAAARFSAVVHDALPDRGPLVGITAGLERATHSWLAVLAIDLPAMTPEWFTEIRRECAPGVGVVPRRGGYFEPLAAIYPREMKWPAWEAIARGEYSLQRLIGAGVAQGLLRVREVSAAEEPLFANWNEPTPSR